jgi:Undecaprenyl-phosphate galactose phosphotransferase WbaP
MLRQEWALGFRPLAFFDDEGPPREEKLEGVPYGGTLSDAINSGGLEQGVDTAIFAVPPGRSEHLDRVVNQLTARLRYVILVPEIAEVTTSAVVARDLGGTFGIEAKQNLLNPWARRVKRAFDLFGVVVGGLLISPLLLAIAVLIKLDSPGPVFYKQRRPGLGGEYFSCWKFRTMYRDAELVLAKLLQSDPNLLAEWERERKLRDDPRVTRVGRFLRKTSLDELPQLWNVLRGEMSLVGPRPMLPEEIPEYGKVYKLYKRMRPGITGLWQVSGRSDTSYEERVTMVAYYVCNWSVWLDLVILARTLRSVIFGHGAV